MAADGRARRDPRKTTIREVATHAGVSVSTVSHALSGNRPISAGTRARVQAAIVELGYESDPTARTLRTGRSGLIGLVLRPRDAVAGSLRGTETFNRLSGAIAIEVLERGAGLVHVPDLLDPAAIRVPMDAAILAHPYGNDRVLTEMLRRKLSVVTVEEDPDRPNLPWTVRLNYRDVLTALLDGMRERGARRIMLLTGTEDNAWNRRCREIFLEWAQHRRVSAHHHALYEGAGPAGAARFMTPILEDSDAPDAVVAGPSTFAAGILDAALALGRAVPDELMLAAITDSDASRSASPPISAIDLALEELARNAVDLVFDQLAGGTAPSVPRIVEPVLFWRGSTGI